MTYKIQGVEIFAAGMWNSDRYTIDDLNEMVTAFNENKTGVRPYLKLGHDDKQELLQKDGLPAAGWIENLYVKGDKLVADFSDIPEKIYQLIQDKAYRKVSSEIFHDIKIGENFYNRMLAAVALLGANTPGVMNLKDILNLYSEKGKDLKVYPDAAFEVVCTDMTIFTNKKEGTMATEKEIELQKDLDAKALALKNAEAEKKTFEADQKALKEENDQLKQFKADADKKAAAALVAEQAAKVKAFTAELVSEKLCTPAMKPLIEEILGADKKEYAVKLGKEDKKLSKGELLKETLKLFKAASEVNFEESSEDVEDKGDQVDEAKQHDEILKYAKEHKVTYGQAAKKVAFKKKGA